MAKARALLLVISFVFCISACEKDDICVDGDTPLLIIRFYDILDTTALKAASSLRVIGLGQTTTVNTFNDRSSTDSIAIPLQITSPETGFVLILNSADEDGADTGNRDTLRFTYTPNEVFVSRACGFVMNFDGLEGSLPTDSSPWIQDLQIITPNVANQTSAHVKIFH